MAKVKISQHKESKKEKVFQKKGVLIKEEQERKGVLPDNIDFRRGMGCG